MKEDSADIEHMNELIESLRRKISLYMDELKTLEEMRDRRRRMIHGEGEPGSLDTRPTPKEAAIMALEEAGSNGISARELSFHLKALSDRGELRSKAKNYVFTANDIFRRLRLQEQIVRVGDGKPIRYRKA